MGAGATLVTEKGGQALADPNRKEIRSHTLDAKNRVW